MSTEINTKPKGTIGPVTTAAASGSGVSGAAAVVLVWLLDLIFGVEVSAEVAGAFVILLSAIGALVGGKLVPPTSGRRAL